MVTRENFSHFPALCGENLLRPENLLRTFRLDFIILVNCATDDATGKFVAPLPTLFLQHHETLTGSELYAYLVAFEI